MHSTPFTARLLAATAICTVAATPAFAQTYGLQSTDSTPVTNPSGTTLYGTKTGVLSTGSALDLDNAGTIRGDGLNGSVFNSDGGIIISGGPATITNSGSISGARFGISTIYFTNPDSSTVGLAIGSAVDNSGSIIGDSDDGIRLIGGGSVSNSGLISGRVGVGADGISMFAYNGQNTAGMTSIGSVTNLASGLIEGNRWGVVLFGGGSVDNAGIISHGVNIGGSPLLSAGQAGTLVNSGSINGTISLNALDFATLNNSGVIDVSNIVSTGSSTLTNSGAVNYFASFNTVGSASVNNSGSIGEGLILTKTTTANVTNSGSITATNTPDVVGTTRDAVYSQAALTLTNAAAGSINGYVNGIRSDGASLSLNNAGSIQGNGTTNSARVGDAGVQVTGGPATITNSGSISSANFGITTGYYSDPSTNAASGRAIGSTVSNSGSITGNNNDGVRLIGGGLVTNSGSILGKDAGDVFNYNNTFLRADGVSMFAFSDQDTSGMTGIGTVTNLAGGQIMGNRFGVILSGGGSVSNDGLILGYRGGGILIQGQFDGDTSKTGSVVNDEGAQIWGGITFQNLGSASVDNAGAIDGVNATQLMAGVHSLNALTLNNSATGVIEGSSDGVRSDGASLTLNNAGTIFGLGLDRTETAANGGVIISAGPASITNSGSISGATYGITSIYFTNPDGSTSDLAIDTTIDNSGSIIGDNNDGIRIHGGTVTNSGYIAGRARVGADGVSILAFDGQDLSGLSSAGIGTVNNLFGGVIEGYREGIIISDGGTVNNAGTINGGYRGAIVLEARDAGRIGTLTNSGTINGVVDFIQVASASLANSGAILAPAAAAVHGWSFDNYMGPLAVTNDATGTIVGGTNGIFSEGASLSLTNAGSIRGNGTSVTPRVADAGILITGGPASITNSGSISGAGFGITTGTFSDFFTNAASSRAINSTVTNTGSIIGDNNDGVRLIGGGTVTNSGLISGRVGGGADGVSMFAFEDQATTAQIGTVSNLAGGTIDGHRFGIILSGGGTVSNAGTINGGTNGAILIQTGFVGGKTGNVNNSSTINGSVAFNDLASASVTNSGAIAGALRYNGTGTGSLTNSGTVTAATGDAVYAEGPLTISIGAGGTINTSGSGYAIQAGGSSLTLNNSGRITSPSGFGVLSLGSVNATNSGTISSNNGGITGYSGGTITNSGSIIAAAGGIHLSSTTATTGTVNNLAGGLIQGGTGPSVWMDSSVSGTVTNAGTMNGDVALLGPSGTLTNSGSVNGLVVFSGSPATLTNSGTITGYGSTAVYGVRTLTNSGIINGGSGTAVSMTSGNDNVALKTGSSISGAVDGSNGSDTLTLLGTIATPTASQTVGRFLNFEILNASGGYWTAPTTTGTFSSTTINGGALAVNGTITSPITVNSGGLLAGTGTVTGNTTLNSGSILAPGGGSIGTLNITGNVAFNAGSTFSVQTNPSGTSDKLAVTGLVNIATGAGIQVLAGIATYPAAGMSFTIMTATGGINGKFDKAVTDYNYYNVSVNVQKKGVVTLNLTPNGKPLPSAATATTFSAATAIDSLDTTNPIYLAVFNQSLTGARQAFSTLSGNAYNRLDALLAGGPGRMQLGLDADDDTALGLNWSGIQTLASQSLDSGSFMRRGHLSLLMVRGRYVTRLASDSIDADVDSRFVATGVAYRSGHFQALAGVGGAWHDVSVGRTIAFPGFAERTQSHYSAQTSRIDVETSYALLRGKFAPYAGYSRVMTGSSAFGESGAFAALTFQANDASVDQLRAGIRLQGKLVLAGMNLAPHVDASVQRSWSDPAGGRGAHFVIGGNRFESIGVGFDERMARIDAGLDAQAGPVTLTASYRGQFGNRWVDQSAVIRAALRF